MSCAEGVDAVLEIIGSGGEGVLAVLGEEVGDPLAATAAADESELDFGVGCGAEDRFGGEDEQGGGGG